LKDRAPDIRHQQRAFAKMDTNRTKWREQARRRHDLNIGWMHNSMKQQPQRIDKNMALLALIFLPAS